MHDVEAGLARAETTHDRVEIGPVHVGDGAGFLDRGDDGVDLVLEDAERRWVGDHQGSDVGPERRAKGGEVDAATLVGGDGHGRVADHRGGRRIRAVGAVGHEDLRPLLALAVGAVKCARHEHAGQLTMGTGRRLEADGGEAADLEQQLARSHWSSRLPCAIGSGSSGCESVNPVSRAAHSFTFGLYFIVHEPSG